MEARLSSREGGAWSWGKGWVMQALARGEIQGPPARPCSTESLTAPGGRKTREQRGIGRWRALDKHDTEACMAVVSSRTRCPPDHARATHLPRAPKMGCKGRLPGQSSVREGDQGRFRGSKVASRHPVYGGRRGPAGSARGGAPGESTREPESTVGPWLALTDPLSRPARASRPVNRNAHGSLEGSEWGP